MLSQASKSRTAIKTSKPAKKSKSSFSFYLLPLKQDTFQLTLDMLNNHSGFRFPERPFLSIRLRKHSFSNEILTFSIQLGDETKEEQVYIRVQQGHLAVSCSAGSNESFISRYAYFALYELIFISGYYDFERFYWPGFFDSKTGKSKYLNIINDRAGMDIALKPNYNFFYKPGQQLIFPFQEKVNVRSKMNTVKDSINIMNEFAIGYCLADTRLIAPRFPHFPFLVPYTGIWNAGKENIRGFHQFLTDQQLASFYKYSATQRKLNAICFKMRELALIHPHKGAGSEKAEMIIKRENIKRMKNIFLLWQKVIPLLEGQSYTHEFFSYGMDQVKGKPKKRSMSSISFSAEIPVLSFVLRDKKDYYELELRIKVGDKTFSPTAGSPIFFIGAAHVPGKFYLLGTMTDYKVLRFFERYSFKLSILKCHYQGHFKYFIDHLATVYRVENKGANCFNR